MGFPQSINDIKLYQWTEFLEYLDTNPNDNDLSIMAISLFCEISTEAVRKLKQKEKESILSQITTAIAERVPFASKFTLNQVDYGFIPNLDKLSIGEFADIETFEKDKKDLWKIMSILYRPIVEEQPYSHYAIEPYSGRLNADFKDMPVGVMLSAHVFFCNLGQDLLAYILKSLEGTKKGEATSILRDSLKSGDGLDSFMDFVMGTSLIWTKFQNSLSIQPLCFQPTKLTGKISKTK